MICGEIDGTKGPVQNVMIDPQYLDVEVPANKTITFPFPKEHTILAYVIDGKAFFDLARKPFAHQAAGINYFDMDPPCECVNGTLVLYEKNGDHIAITTDAHSVRFLLISGKPLNEPIAWYGPIVMNTEDELRTAFSEYRQGTFVK